MSTGDLPKFGGVCPRKPLEPDVLSKLCLLLLRCALMFVRLSIAVVSCLLSESYLAKGGFAWRLCLEQREITSAHGIRVEFGPGTEGGTEYF